MLHEIIPQANEPWRLAGTVAAVGAGCHSAADIAAAIEVDPRQGAYYGAAAEAVGLLDRHGEQAMWSLTSLGHRIDGAAAIADSSGDASLLTTRLAGVLAADPRVTTLLEADCPEDRTAALAALEADFIADGLGHTTAARRASTIDAWARFVADTTTERADAVAASAAAARAAAPALVAARQAAEAAAKAAEAARAPAYCTSCFIQLPATGDCAGCA